MNQYKSIFIKYSAVFFLIVLGLISFGQFHDLGKIDLKFSLPIASMLGLFGGVIAAVFIVSFKKLDTDPLPVQPSQYLEIDENVLNSKKAKVKHSRRIFFAIFIFWPVYGITISELGLPEYFIFAYMIAFLFFGNRFGSVKCPRCGNQFFSREVPNKFYVGWYHNILSNKCLNCGLSIKSN